MSSEKNVTLVNGLVAIDLTSVSARLLVVELAETGGVEVRRDRKHPSGGNGVQRLVCINILFDTFAIFQCIAASGNTYEVASRVED